MAVTITKHVVRVELDARKLNMLQRHAWRCPMCLDEAHGTRGCPKFEGTVESFLLELGLTDERRVTGAAADIIKRREER